jgi:class 3 adenylate cyclase
MRSGLNSGPVVVGAIGDDLCMDYTAVGETTNPVSNFLGEVLIQQEWV